MPRITRFKKTLVASLFVAVTAISIACTGGGSDAASPTSIPQPTATAITSANTGGSTVTPTDVVPTPPATDVPISNPVADLTALEVVKAQEQVLIDLFEDTIDSVVKIETRTRSGGGGEGSGWIWDVDGHIVTNYHVVDGATAIFVSFFDGRQYDGRVIGFNSEADLAVVKIDPEPDDVIQPAELGDSSSLQVGQMSVALGNPFGQDFSMTQGIVSAVGRLLPSGFSRFSIPSVIQTDAAINPGNSGGPLLDIDGRVIGINTQIRSESGSNSGVGFAVPVDLAKRVVPNLIQNGEHSYSFIGITGRELNNSLRDGLGVDNTQQGAYITDVSGGTPASTAGLRAESGDFNIQGELVNGQFDGDLIVAVDGQDVRSMDDLIAYLALNTSPGDDILLTVLRAGQEDLVVVTLTDRP